MRSTKNTNTQSDGMGLQEITSVKWTDDDGTQCRQTIKDGGIIDREIYDG